jgi:hypothetical protein
MSGQVPSFITGANAKIKLGSMTMAYAQDVSYAVEVSTIPVETIGRYEVVTNEPVAYYVSGSLSVIRYTSNAAAIAGLPGASSNTTGNSINTWEDQTTSATVGWQFDPAQMLASKTFDLDIFSKLNASGNELVVKIRDCRFTRKTGAVTKRGLIVDQFSFSAVLMDHDGEVATGGSGDKDLNG